MGAFFLPTMTYTYQNRHALDGRGEYHQMVAMDVSQTFSDKNFPDEEPDSNYVVYERQDLGQNNVSVERERQLCQRIFPTGFKYEAVELLKFSWPVVATQVLNRTIRIMPTVFSGQLGKMQLGGTSMAISIANVAASSLGIGMIAGCETLFSQSYGSANKRQVGVYLQTAIFMSILLCVVSWGILLNTNSILLVLGQNKVIAKYTEEYLFIFMPAIFFLFMYQLLARYLQVQGFILPCVFIGLFANACDILLQYLFVYLGGLGVKGSAIAQFLTYFILAASVILYIILTKSYKVTWGGWSRASLQDWGQFFTLGFSTVMMVSMEWWAFEVSMFLMGLLSSVALGANSIMYQIWMLYASISLGFGSAIAYRVGRYLGAETPMGAKTVAHVSLVLGLILATVTATLTLCLRWQLPRIFSQDKDVVDLGGSMLPILAIFSFFGATKNVCAGIVRGTGKQVYGAIVITVSYFVFALPIGIPLMFLTKVKAAGFWWGLNIGLLIAAIALITIVFRLDWFVEVGKALVRAKIVWKAKRNQPKSESGKPNLNRQQENGEGVYGSVGEKDHIPLTERHDVANGGPPIHNSKYWRNLFLKRILIVVLCVSVLFTGILCRFIFFIPSHNSSSTNSSTLINYTTIHT